MQHGCPNVNCSPDACPCYPAQDGAVGVKGDPEEQVARRIFNDAHAGMANCYDWDTAGLEDEHPGIIDRFRGYAASAIAALTSPSPAQEEHRYAERLLIALMEKHYPDRSPDWEPLPDLMGVLTQIDNLTTGLVRASPAQEAGAEPCDACCGTGEHQGGRITIQKQRCRVCNGTGYASPPLDRGDEWEPVDEPDWAPIQDAIDAWAQRELADCPESLGCIMSWSDRIAQVALRAAARSDGQ